MPRKKNWRKGLAKKAVGKGLEDPGLVKNRIKDCEDPALLKTGSNKTSDRLEDPGLVKNRISDCEDPALLKTGSQKPSGSKKPLGSKKPSGSKLVKDPSGAKKLVEMPSGDKTPVEKPSGARNPVDESSDVKTGVNERSDAETLPDQSFGDNTVKSYEKTEINREEAIMKGMQNNNMKNFTGNRKRLYNIMLITGKADRKGKVKITDSNNIDIRANESTKSIKPTVRKRRKLYNVMLITAKADRKGKNKTGDGNDVDGNENHMSQNSNSVTNKNRKCSSKKLPLAKGRYSCNKVSYSRGIKTRNMKIKTCAEISRKSNDGNKKKLNRKGKNVLKTTAKTKHDIKPSTPRDYKSKANQHQSSNSSKKAFAKSCSKGYNSEKSEKVTVGISKDMKKMIEQRIEKISSSHNTSSECLLLNGNDRSDVAGKEENKKRIEGDILHKKCDEDDVIFEGESGPTEFNFNALSAATQQKLTRKLGISSGITPLNVHTAVKCLGKPKQMKSIEGDGNCFFRAVSYSISGEQKYHGEVRQCVVDHMLRNDEQFDSHLRSGYKSVRDWVLKKNMLEIGTWATEIEILALADFLCTDVYIYEENMTSWLKFSAKQVDRNKQVEQEAIYLIHRYRAHYDVVVSVEEKDQNIETFAGCNRVGTVKERTAWVKSPKKKSTSIINPDINAKTVVERLLDKGNECKLKNCTKTNSTLTMLN